MKKLNLFNRCMIYFYSRMAFVLRICAISSCVYIPKDKIFISNKKTRIYMTICTSINAMFLLGILLALKVHTPYFYHRDDINIMLKFLISFFARFHQATYEDGFIELLNELYQIHQDIRALTRHPNFFRLPHFVLCAVALQSMIRSTVIGISNPRGTNARVIVFEIIFVWFYIVTVLTFNILVTAVMLIFILLIACYDELHRCTKRISNDVRTLRLGQQMEGGQRLVLVRQLGELLAHLIAVRGQMFNFTRRFIKFFRLHLVLSILYWIGHEVMIVLSHNNASEVKVFWEILIGLMNIAFYCSIFEIFMWKSKLSRSFWNFHLTNFDAGFDRTVDQLLHCELVEYVKVTAYGIQLNMRLFCKVLLLTLAYLLMHYQFQKIQMIHHRTLSTTGNK